MTDPLRTDRLPEAGDVPERDRDARVEDLLLTGLDHYFVGQYELAISVWTRVLFLDRGHARAKAYIDRARSAIAEQQRESEELLHTGAAAVDRGDAGAARRLLTSAMERGAASEEALALMERVNRLEIAGAPQTRLPGRPLTDTLPVPFVQTERTGTSRAGWIAIGVLTGLGAAGLAAWVALTNPEWLPFTTSPAPAAAVPAANDPLPVPAPSEAWLSRARNLYSEGRLRDALSALDPVGHGDPLKPQADELRAAIQRRLLDAGRAARTTSGPGSPAATAGPPREP
jgi:hypothetical protein